MVDSLVFECGICVRQYDEICIPLSLPCGHVFCKSCMLTYCRDSTTVCPADKSYFEVSVSQLPVCQPLIQPRTRSKLLECVRHPKRRVKYCCKLHSAYLCSECILNHLGSGHEVVACRPSVTGIRQQIKALIDQSEQVAAVEVQTNSRLAQLDFRIRSHYERELTKLNSCFENSIRGLQSQKTLNISSLHRHEETGKVGLQMNRHSINALMSKCHALVSDIDRLNQSLTTVNPDHFFKTLDARRSELGSIRRALHSKAGHGELFVFDGKR
jgi:hypothetical protein